MLKIITQPFIAERLKVPSGEITLFMTGTNAVFYITNIQIIDHFSENKIEIRAKS